MVGDELADAFRPLVRIFEPDPRQLDYVVIEETGVRKKEFEDQYREVERFKISTAVPQAVAIQFDTAKELLVHAWCNVRFAQIAERHAYATVEMALRMRLQSECKKDGAAASKRRKRAKSGPGLAKLLRSGIDIGIITDEGFHDYKRICERQAAYLESMRQIYSDDPTNEPPPPTANRYALALSDWLPLLRNELAHGSPTLYPGVYLQFEICCDILNQLYPR
jgi:hypothetical protein